MTAGWIQKVQEDVYQAIRAVAFGGATSTQKTFALAKIDIENSVGRKLTATKLDKSPDEWELKMNSEVPGGGGGHGV